MFSLHPTQMCWICGKAVDAQTRAIDEHGSTVHELCYAVKRALAAESLKLEKIRPRPVPRETELTIAK